MKGLKVANSPLTNNIYAGKLLKSGRGWAAGKQDVTIDALSAVVDHCLCFQESEGKKVALTSSTHKFIISVEKIEVDK